MSGRNIRKSEWILPALTGLFLCCLLALFLCDRAKLKRQSVVTEVSVPQEEILPDLTPLDLNAATAEQLQMLPSVGEELAARIVAWREENGPFESVEQIMEVSGIGEGKFAALEGRITVQNEGRT